MERFSHEIKYGCRVILTKISPKRDLVCCATENGELTMHRFEKLEKVWRFDRLEHFPNAKITQVNTGYKPFGQSNCRLAKLETRWKSIGSRLYN